MLTSAKQQIHALDTAFSANSILVTRFLVAPSADLRGCHFSFDSATRAAHPKAGRYVWHAPALKSLFTGKFLKINGLNSPSGALALKRHLTGINYKHVSDAEMYTVASALDEVSAFGMLTFAALGYSSSPTFGLSLFADLVAMQKDFVTFASTQGHL
eukprot:4904478-Pleurochrysis_carterae.AAC.1